MKSHEHLGRKVEIKVDDVGGALGGRE